MDTEMSRRDFLGAGTGAVTVFAFSLVPIPGLEQMVRGAQPEPVAEIPVIWITGSSCSGCSVALLNSASPTIEDLVLDEVLPKQHISLGFHSTIMAAQGEQAMEQMARIARERKGHYILMVEGAIPIRDGGRYCGIGEVKGRHFSASSHIRELAGDALAVIAVGAARRSAVFPLHRPTRQTPWVSAISLIARKSGLRT